MNRSLAVCVRCALALGSTCVASACSSESAPKTEPATQPAEPVRPIVIRPEFGKGKLGGTSCSVLVMDKRDGADPVFVVVPEFNSLNRALINRVPRHGSIVELAQFIRGPLAHMSVSIGDHGFLYGPNSGGLRAMTVDEQDRLLKLCGEELAATPTVIRPDADLDKLESYTVVVHNDDDGPGFAYLLAPDADSVGADRIEMLHRYESLESLAQQLNGPLAENRIVLGNHFLTSRRLRALTSQERSTLIGLCSGPHVTTGEEQNQAPDRDDPAPGAAQGTP